MVGWDKTVTIYKRTLDPAKGAVWQRQVLTGVFVGHVQKVKITGNALAYVDTNYIRIPASADVMLNDGDAVAYGAVNDVIPDGKSANDLLKAHPGESFEVKTVKDNRFTAVGISHVYGGDA